MHVPRIVLLFACLAPVACSASDANSPFSRDDAGSEVDASADSGEGDASPDVEPDPTLGGPCVDDAQCDDGIACTADRCDLELYRCRFVPDDSLCQDGLYCNGVEVCDTRLGCRQGPPRTCSDGDSCTIDRCSESTQSCEHAVRDADMDGDPDAHCGGGDCDDADPTVSSKRAEICGNDKDDNCNGLVDESPCESPAHDRCADALEIHGPGSYSLSTTAASHDYATSCSPSGPFVRDVVAVIEIPEGPRRDLDIVAEVANGEIALGVASVCGQGDTELACGQGSRLATGGTMARVRARDLPPGRYPVYVFTDRDITVALRVAFLDPAPKPQNETCGTALTIAPFAQTPVSLVDPARDLGSMCHGPLGELVYAFTVSATSDVRIRASSLDGFGAPIVSLRDEDCALPEDEIACASSDPTVLYRRALDRGTYYVAVSATAPTELKLVVELSPPTDAPADESCENAPTIAHNVTVSVPLAGHVDDVAVGCSVGFVDAAYSLELTETSDVLLVQRFAQNDVGAVQLARPACESSADLLACGISGQSPARASARKVPPGSYRAVVETMLGGDATLTAFVRPYSPPTLVAFADTCDDAVLVPPSGGFFQGNTANANADYPAGCDYGSGAPNGAPEQMLRLELPSKKRVVFDMSGSGYTTLLDVRKGPDCPGLEMPSSCSVGYSAARSYLDRTLEAGTYWIQIDGYAGASGPWFLDIRVVDP